MPSATRRARFGRTLVTGEGETFSKANYNRRPGAINRANESNKNNVYRNRSARGNSAGAANAARSRANRHHRSATRKNFTGLGIRNTLNSWGLKPLASLANSVVAAVRGHK